MKTSDRGITMIKSFEGLSMEAYRCAAGIWTIGYGHTKGVRTGQRVTQEEAEALLHDDICDAEGAVSQCGILNQNQFDALVSFVFNVGLGAFGTSTLKKMVAANPNDTLIKNEMMKWKYATVNGRKVVLPSLQSRRIKEAELYFTK